MEHCHASWKSIHSFPFTWWFKVTISRVFFFFSTRAQLKCFYYSVLETGGGKKYNGYHQPPSHFQYSITILNMVHNIQYHQRKNNMLKGWNVYFWKMWMYNCLFISLMSFTITFGQILIFKNYWNIASKYGFQRLILALDF